jgi:bacterioferritin (cytochrome b1)
MTTPTPQETCLEALNFRLEKLTQALDYFRLSADMSYSELFSKKLAETNAAIKWVKEQK